MALKMTVDNLEGMDAGLAKLYVEREGKFHLDVDGHDKNEDQGNRIPKQRLDQEIAKRKESDATLAEIAQGFVEEVPEDMRDLIPDLAPASKIKWIQNATKKGLFNPKIAEGIDTKRPGRKAPESFDGMSPQAIMAKGYKTTK